MTKATKRIGDTTPEAERPEREGESDTEATALAKDSATDPGVQGSGGADVGSTPTPPAVVDGRGRGPRESVKFIVRRAQEAIETARAIEGDAAFVEGSENKGHLTTIVERLTRTIGNAEALLARLPDAE